MIEFHIIRHCFLIFFTFSILLYLMFNSFCVQIIANTAIEHRISVTILIKDLYEQNSSNLFESFKFRRTAE